jgi:tripartite-type tricarboxylate transporter receptor subunit TctC
MMLPDVRERLAALGLEAVVNRPEEFADWIRTEMARWDMVIREAHINMQ